MLPRCQCRRFRRVQPSAEQQTLRQRPPRRSARRDLNFHYGGFQALHGISMEIYDKQGDGFYRTFRLRKVDILRTLNRMNETVRGTRVEGKILLDGEDIFDHGSVRTCAAASAWCSSARIRFRNRSSKTSPMDCASTAWREPQRVARQSGAELAPSRPVGRSQRQIESIRLRIVGRTAAAPVHRPRRWR